MKSRENVKCAAPDIVPNFRTYLSLLACWLLAACTSSRPAANNWQLFWSDEFEHDGVPDPTRWDCEVGQVRNGELQHYTRDRRENARVENGCLVLEARREDFAGAEFTSASLITRNRASFEHARIEVAAKLPRGRGLWPAIWLLGINWGDVGWPECGEIDVMEFVGFDPDAVHSTVHTASYNHMRGNGRGARIPLAGASDGFHIYAVEWDAERMVFAIDGRTTFTVANDHTGTDSWPFDAPFFLLLNVAVGGSWGGQQGVDASVFPQRMEVDWVRVWLRSQALPSTIRAGSKAFSNALIESSTEEPSSLRHGCDPRPNDSVFDAQSSGDSDANAHLRGLGFDR